MTQLAADDRVTLTGDVDLYPYATLKRGERGTVLWADYEDGLLTQLEIRLDTHHYGLSLFENCALLAGAAAALVEPLVEPLMALINAA